MVTVLHRPAVLDITADEERAIYNILSGGYSLTPDEVASAVRLDENDVAIYLANEAGLGHIQAEDGRYTTWHWL